MAQEILSAGIDIGTTTSQVIFSRLRLEDNSYTAVPDVKITQKEVLYKSPVYFTPLGDDGNIDAQALEPGGVLGGAGQEMTVAVRVHFVGQAFLAPDVQILGFLAHGIVQILDGGFQVRALGVDAEHVAHGVAAHIETLVVGQF